MSLQRRAMLLPAWLLTAITASLSAAEEFNWQEHVHESGNFRVSMPGELIYDGTMDDAEIEGSDDSEMRAIHTVLKSGDSGASFMAMSVKHSPEFLAKYNPKERINFLQDRELLEFHQKSPDVKFELHREPRVVQGYSGEYMRIKLPGPELWESHTVVFYAGEVLYSAEVIIASQDSASPLSPSDVEKFLSSFALLAKTFELDGIVTSIASTADARTILMGSRGGNASIWDSQTGMPLRDFQIAKGHWDGKSENHPELSVAISHDGKQFMTGSAQGVVALWEVATGKQVRTLRQNARKVQAVAFSPDGRLGAAQVYDDGVFVWDVDSGKEVARFRVDGQTIESFTISPEGRRLAIRLHDHSRSSENKFHVYDVASEKLLYELAVRYPRDAAFSPDGNILATASGTDVRVWNAETGQELQRLDKFRLPHDAARVAFSQDGKFIGALATGYDQATVRVWNLNDNGVSDEFPQAKLGFDEFTSISFTPDNEWLLVAGIDGVTTINGGRGFVLPLKLELAKPGALDSKRTDLKPVNDSAGDGEARRGRPRESRPNGQSEAGGDAIRRSELRTWTEANGTRTLRAELIGADNEYVKVRLQNGKVASARLSAFSEQDQKFVRQMLASRNGLETTKTPRSENIAAAAATHQLSGRLEPGAMLKGRAKQPSTGVWTCRLEIVDVESNAFQGVLYLDSVQVGRNKGLVGASLELEGLLSGRDTVHFTVTRIRTPSRHPAIFLGDENVGLVYRGAVRGDRIVGRARSSFNAAGGGITMEFVLPTTKVVSLSKVSSSTPPTNSSRE